MYKIYCDCCTREIFKNYEKISISSRVENNALFYNRTVDHVCPQCAKEFKEMINKFLILVNEKQN